MSNKQINAEEINYISFLILSIIFIWVIFIKDAFDIELLFSRGLCLNI